MQNDLFDITEKDRLDTLPIEDLQKENEPRTVQITLSDTPVSKDKRDNSTKAFE
jgi:hypothetical protein